VAQVVWTNPALADLEAVAEYVAIENPTAAAGLVTRIVRHVEQLADHPASGSRPRERGCSHLRQIVEPPCRIFYRHFDGIVLIVHVMRTERTIDMRRLIETREEPES
jgi:plasmid stabilization system protein ParE